MKRKSRPGVLPAVSSPYWNERTRALLNFLEEPRNWFELGVWARANKVGGYLLRNYLAYLEDSNEAEGISVRVKATGEILWLWRSKDPSAVEEIFPGYEQVDPSHIYRGCGEEADVVSSIDTTSEDDLDETEL